MKKGPAQGAEVIHPRPQGLKWLSPILNPRLSFSKNTSGKPVWAVCPKPGSGADQQKVLGHHGVEGSTRTTGSARLFVPELQSSPSGRTPLEGHWQGIL